MVIGTVERVAATRVRRIDNVAGAHLRRIGRHLLLAWPVFVVFLTQRLLTAGFLYRDTQGLGSLALRWDAGWYLRLAEGGYVYPNLTADGDVKASNLAYFPLLPWLARQVADSGLLSLNQALVALAWAGGLLAVWAIFAVGNALYGRSAGIALAALWGMAPASLALTMGYPEGMFTAAAAAALYFLIRRRPVWAGGCAVVAGLLRPSAVAVVAMIAAYFLVELARWFAERRSRTIDRPPVARHAMTDGTVTDGTVTDGTDRGTDRGTRWFAGGLSAGRLRPFRAFLGALLSTLGLAGFMVYVGLRTGQVFGYFTVQGQWGQRSGGLAEYWQGIEQGLLGPQPLSLVAVNIVVCLGYLLLFCLVVTDRKLVWASVYAAGLLLISLTHITFQHVYARQLLPAFVLLIPLIRMRVSRTGAILALTVGSIAMSWGSAEFLQNVGSGM